jgi:hypothetical protein
MQTVAAFILAIAGLLLAHASAQEHTRSSSAASPQFDATSRFIFYSVLEGLYEDGLSNEDVDQILLKRKGQSYFHFIYACPICTATIWGLQAYRSRPEHLYSLKSGASTFGSGLSDSLHAHLYSDDPHQRLIAINALVKSWLSRRMEKLNLSEDDRKVLLKKLEEKRQNGMDVLESFRKGEHGPHFGVAEAAPAYVNLEECAVCNGAVGKLMKLPHDEPKEP